MTTLSVILFFVTLAMFALLLVLKGKKAWQAVVGPDGRLDIPEFIVGVWAFIFFPMAFAADLWLNKTLSTPMIVSLDTIMSFALGGSVVNAVTKIRAHFKDKQDERRYKK